MGGVVKLMVVAYLCHLPVFWLFIAASIKRLHDAGWHGWWFPLAGFVWSFINAAWAMYNPSLEFSVVSVLFVTVTMYLQIYTAWLGVVLFVLPKDKSANKFGPVVVGKK